MADKSPERLFTIPADMMKSMEEGYKQLQTLKALQKDLQALGQDTTDMQRQIETLEKQYALIKRYTKNATITPTSKK